MAKIASILHRYAFTRRHAALNGSWMLLVASLFAKQRHICLQATAFSVCFGGGGAGASSGERDELASETHLFEPF